MVPRNYPSFKAKAFQDGFIFIGQSAQHKHNNHIRRGHPYRVVDNNDTTPLLIAILREDVEMVKLLIRYGATFVPEGELCQDYLKELSSWTIRDLLEEAYGGKTYE